MLRVAYIARGCQPSLGLNLTSLSSLLSVGPVRTTTLGPNTRETTGSTVRTTYKLWHIRFCSKKFSVIGETGENKSKQLQFIEEALLQTLKCCLKLAI
ncbi:hypothetical protein ACKS0A_02546 [Histoplasma ohiense]